MSSIATLAEPAVNLSDWASGTYLDDLLAQLDAADHRPVLVRAGGSTTGAELRDSIFRYARALLSCAIGPGDLVALWAPNEPEAIAVRIAAQVAGAATMYLPDTASVADRARLLDEIDPQLLVVFAATEHLLPPRCAVPIASIGCDAGARLDVLAAVQDGGPLPVLARPDDLAAVISSGGSTGVPKGSTHTFAVYAAMVEGPCRPERRQLVNGELAHLSQVLVDQTLLGGGTVVLADSCDPVATLAAIDEQRITDVFLVEPQLADVIDEPSLGLFDLSTLRAVVHIGASAPPSLRRRAREVLGPVVVHTYGASEIGIVSRSTSGFTTAGPVLPGVDVRFRGAGEALVPAGPGIIEIASAATAGGYRNRDVPEAGTFLDDGWVRTADLGCLDDRFELVVLGRTADIAVVGGQLVRPMVIEEALMSVPGARLASVVANGRGGWVAAVVAWRRRVVDTAACADAIAEAYDASVAAMVTVVVVEALPLTGQGKPDRAKIVELADAGECLGFGPRVG